MVALNFTRCVSSCPARPAPGPSRPAERPSWRCHSSTSQVPLPESPSTDGSTTAHARAPSAQQETHAAQGRDAVHAHDDDSVPSTSDPSPEDEWCALPMPLVHLAFRRGPILGGMCESAFIQLTLPLGGPTQGRWVPAMQPQGCRPIAQPLLVITVCRIARANTCLVSLIPWALKASLCMARVPHKSCPSPRLSMQRQAQHSEWAFVYARMSSIATRNATARTSVDCVHAHSRVGRRGCCPCLHERVPHGPN